MAEIDVKSEIQGVVWQVLVTPGQAVAEGDELIVLESMKMEIPVMAPAPGTVQSIAFGEGDEVAEGAVIAVIST